MHLVDLHEPTSRRARIWTPDLRGLTVTQAMHTAAAQWFAPLSHKGKPLLVMNWTIQWVVNIRGIWVNV